MKIGLLLLSLFAFALPASAGMNSIQDRAAAVKSQTEGNDNYHAQLARKLAAIAVEEKGQHDLHAAKEFINMAEEHAAQAGGAK
ncbi:MAG: hypothetical protein COW48_04640 [Hydrogenophilales bacterium CG17_big_fil_post_rev_8_21_14_2_50_63_12]|nr:MAG: hypothetical protein COW48_04640 [Hydrogenophilales bacterium CG17_big_fil_post_rev_8_21_14_2_50_63_12]PJA33629.1 MAG: hypothetical protein CO187_00975 [Zetaproteobacteria bacterium CG_4_9_14_3_um_filter_53_7]